LSFHVVFVTKFRNKVIDQNILEFIKTIFPQIAKSINIEIDQINGLSDHIHFIMRLTPQDKICNIIGTLKSKSASLIHDKFDLSKFYWEQHKRTLWSSGYFVCTTGGAPIEIIKKYIENQ